MGDFNIDLLKCETSQISQDFLLVLPKNTFKKVLRTSLLNILQNEDDYIQIPVIIKKVGEVDQ